MTFNQESNTYDTLGNIIEEGDEVVVMDVGRGTVTVRRAIITRISSSKRVYYDEYNVDGTKYAGQWRAWTSAARIIKHTWSK